VHDPRLTDANEAYQAGRWEECAPLWEAIFSDTSDLGEKRLAGRRAAYSYRRSGNFADALRVLRSLVAELPPDPSTRRELARFEIARRRSQAPDKYWLERQRFLYIQVTKEIARRIAGNANSIMDVGSNGTPILDWFPEVPLRVSVDLRKPYVADGIESVKEDFLTWEPSQRFDVGLCLQVLEHVADAEAFAQHLLRLCEVVIISVPYRWPEEASSYHVHDPVDEEKLKTWFHREPNFTYRIAELHGQERLISVYDDQSHDLWRSVPEDLFRYRWSLRGVDRLLADDGDQAGV
jgi:hypothetical protein